MKKIFFAFIFGIFLTGLISASGVQICIDHESPSAPTNLILTQSGNNIQLNWNSATDAPDCSGIDFYDIYRGFNGGNLSLIGNTNNINYLDENLAYGTYTYIIHAWDLAGHNEGGGVSNSILLKTEDNGNHGNHGNNGGGSGSGSSTYWQCGKWGECIEGISKRVCEDISGYLSNKTETKICFPEFTKLNYQENNQSKPEETITNEKQQPIFSLLGAVIGVGEKLGRFKSFLSIFFIFGILIAVMFIFVVRRKRKIG